MTAMTTAQGTLGAKRPSRGRAGQRTDPAEADAQRHRDHARGQAQLQTLGGDHAATRFGVCPSAMSSPIS